MRMWGSSSWNLLRTEFRILCRWCMACEPGASPFSTTTPANERQDLGAIVYEKNWLGHTPRKLHLVMPPIDRRNPKAATCMCPAQGHPPLTDSFHQGQLRMQHLLHLTTRAPVWNDAIQRHEMAFTERVSHASVHNFQLVAADDRAFALRSHCPDEPRNASPPRARQCSDGALGAGAGRLPSPQATIAYSSSARWASTGMRWTCASPCRLCRRWRPPSRRSKRARW
jgi:hypothetical protein